LEYFVALLQMSGGEDTTTLAFYSLGAIIVCGITLYIYHFHIDPYKNIERFYFKNSKMEYAAFKAAHSVLMLSMILSARFLLLKWLPSNIAGKTP